ncbi:hypothetical protein SOVF_149170 [Spinacia oleracea]|nr:hypothetical protein SOVF_149170 [Spinacia oleracea]
MNGHDSGMFVIKYMEAHHISEWRKIRYTTEEMRVEHLKYLVKILKSEFNHQDYKTNVVKEIVSVS